MQRVPQLKWAATHYCGPPFFCVSERRFALRTVIKGGITIDNSGRLASDDGNGIGDFDLPLTARSLIRIDYFAPPIEVSDYVTTLYHMTCDEQQIRDIQPASVGHLSLFPYGRGEMWFPGGRRESNPEVALLTPLSTASPIVLDGPFHAIGAALTPLGWAALTGLHAGEHGNHLYDARAYLGDRIADTGDRLIADYRSGLKTGEDCAYALAKDMADLVQKVNRRHLEFIRTVNSWLGDSFNPDVADLHASAAYGTRQVQRLCERYFGLPPRSLARKYRALRAASLLSLPNLTPEYEAELGRAFFDQSHMIREIRCFVGCTPAKLGGGDNQFLSEMVGPWNLRELDG